MLFLIAILRFVLHLVRKNAEENYTHVHIKFILF